MAKKEDQEDDKKKKSAAEEKAEEKDEEPSEEVEIVLEEEPAPKKKAKEEGEEDGEAEAEVEQEGESAKEKEQRLSKSQERKQRQREAREAKDRELLALRNQLAETTGRLNQIEQRGQADDYGRIEQGIYEAQGQMSEAKRIIARALEEKNGEALAQANDALYEARRRAELLLAEKQRYVQQAQQPRAQPPDPLLVKHARDWMSKNRWYDPRGLDNDSKIALSIDQMLASEGMDPRTEGYWEEFNERVAKYLPHRATVQRKRVVEEEEQDDDPPQSQTRGSGRESGGGGGKITFRISKDRVDAMKEAGQWDQFQSDKTFRARMIKRFKDSDEKHGTR
jgi:hypothetical protein